MKTREEEARKIEEAMQGTSIHEMIEGVEKANDIVLGISEQLDGLPVSVVSCIVMTIVDCAANSAGLDPKLLMQWICDSHNEMFDDVDEMVRKETVPEW